jgi:hypothetical protein
MDTKTLDRVFQQTRNNMMRFLHGDDDLIAQLPRQLPGFLLDHDPSDTTLTFAGCSHVEEMLYRQYLLSAFLGSLKLESPPHNWRQHALLLSELQLKLAREKFRKHKLLILALRYELAASQLAEPENCLKREAISKEIDNLGQEIYGQWQPLYAAPTGQFFYGGLELLNTPKHLKALNLAEFSAKTAEWGPIQQISGNQMKNPGPNYEQLILLRDRFIEEMKQRFPCFVTAGIGRIGMENGILAFYDSIPFDAPTEFNGALVRNEDYRQAMSELQAAKQKGLSGISA